MPRKKTDNPESGENGRHTAPKVPKTLAGEIETSQQITVRKVPVAATPKQQPDEEAAPPVADNMDNPETNRAVDDIMAKESDTVLAVDDILAGKRSPVAQTTSWKDKLRSILRNKWTWIGVGVIICILFALPFTRYKLLGLIIKEKVGVTVIDSQTHTPVSNALVSLGGVKVKTDANGLADLKAGVGEQSLVITKQYYRTTNTHYFIGFKSNQVSIIKLVATGRQVPITVDNIISGQPLADAVIHVLNTTAKTNSKGQASVALPTTSTSDQAFISLSGYNDKQVTVQVTNIAVAANNFNLTPSGSIYFLSNQGGPIDIMKSNLDGSNRQTVLTGTSSETAATTRLMTSSDWHYLVLEANRGGSGPALYLINTSNDQITEFDSNNATFNLVGWYGHDFIYSLNSNTTNQWQSGSQVLKDYDADQHELNQLDQDQALGTSSSYAYQTFSNFFLAGNNVVYSTQWTASGGYDLSSQNDTIRTFQISSQAKKDYQAFPASSTGSIAASRYQPQGIYFSVLSSSSGAVSYYQYDNQNVQAASINQAIFNQGNPTYLVSPTGNRTVWSQLSNGQDVFFGGDNNAANRQQIAALDNYTAYGWYSDSYVLASKNHNQLYILPASGLSGGRLPLNITSYYEPDGTSDSYEYGGF